MTVTSKKVGPPMPVFIAAWLYVIYALLVPLRIWLMSGAPDSLGAALAWLIPVAYFLFLAMAIYKRRRWARWWILAITGLALVFVPFVELKIPSGPEFIVFSCQSFAGLAVPALLLLPASRQWFRPNNSFKPKPLRGSA